VPTKADLNLKNNMRERTLEIKCTMEMDKPRFGRPMKLWASCVIASAVGILEEKGNLFACNK